MAKAFNTLCAQAQSLADSSGQPVLVCLAAPLRAADPLSLLEALSQPGEFRFFWERPKNEFALAAGGEALRFEGAGDNRFGRLAQQVEAALAQTQTGWLEGPDETDGAVTPLVLGGFSYFAQLDATQWPGFKPGLLVAPQWAALYQHGKASLRLQAAAQPGGNSQTLAAGLAATYDRVRRAGEVLSQAAPVLDGETARLDFAQGGDLEGHRQWLEMVGQALQQIDRGQVEKVVLARQVELLCAGTPSPFPVLQQLRSAYPSCYTFLADPGDGQLFLGATPERLARYAPTQDGLIEVRLGALAGTAPRGEAEEDDHLLGERLLSSRKESQEHRMVVEAVLEAARQLGGQLDYPQTPRLVKLNNLQHLYTPITIRAACPGSILGLVGRLHPTPAVGGRPGPQAVALIAASERFDRGWYASPIGWLDGNGQGEFAVALRSAAIQPGRVRLFTGAGIVAGSIPENEYFETQLKLQPLMNAIQHP